MQDWKMKDHDVSERSGLLKAAQRLVNHLKSSCLVLGRSAYFIIS